MLRHHRADIAALKDLRWVGYLSTTGVYGHRGGEWVDEKSGLHPTGPRGRARVEAEQVWIIEYLNEHQISVALHAGDMINPGILYRFRDHYQGHLHFIFGNNDGEKALAERRAEAAENLTCHLDTMEMEIAGKTIFMNHYSAVSEPMVKSGEFDVCIGGHDHQYRMINHGKSLFINPGNTVTKDKWLPQEADQESSFVILDLETMKHERVIVPLDL